LQEAFPDHSRTASVIGFSATSREGVEAADRTLAQWFAA